MFQGLALRNLEKIYRSLDIVSSSSRDVHSVLK